MKTASFFAYTGPGRISIARFAPRGTPAGFRVYRKLAPRPEMLRMDRAEYEPLYNEILASLDARTVWEELHALVDPHEPVLLCWERLHAPGEWCHRTMVAEWFSRELGAAVIEAEPG